MGKGNYFFVVKQYNRANKIKLNTKTKQITLLYGLLGFNILPNSPFSGESHEYLFNHGSQTQVSHKSASEVLTNHPAATAAACATLAKGVCMAITADKVVKKELNKPESNTVKAAGESNSMFESKIIDNINK